MVFVYGFLYLNYHVVSGDGPDWEHPDIACALEECGASQALSGAGSRACVRLVDPDRLPAVGKQTSDLLWVLA